MDHQLTAEKYSIRLRPVRMDDAAFIVRMRNSPHAVGKIGDSAQDVAAQEAWLKKYFDRAGDYYFIIETARSKRPVGVSSLYDVEGGIGEWGRWVVEPGVMAATASMWLSFHLAYDHLGLDALRLTVAEHNVKMISIIERIEAEKLGFQSEARLINSRPVRILEYRSRKSHWPKISADLETKALMEAKFLQSL